MASSLPTPEKLKTYLSAIALMEQYKQLLDKLLPRVQQDLKEQEGRLQEINDRVGHYYLPVKPKKERFSFSDALIGAGFWFLLLWGAGALLGLLFHNVALWSKIGAICGGGFGLIGIWGATTDDDAKAWKKYDKELAEYNAAVGPAAGQQEAVERGVSALQPYVLQMEAQQAELQQLLNRYYNQEVLHVNYQNLAAVSTIMDYLSSGRCIGLTGLNGAYATFEADLRQGKAFLSSTDVMLHFTTVGQTQPSFFRSITENDTAYRCADQELLALRSGSGKDLPKLEGVISDIQGTISAAKTIAETSPLFTQN